MRRYLTNKQLRKIVKYDPYTGIFTSVKTGRPVGAMLITGYVQLRINGIRYPGEKLAWFYMTNTWPEHGVSHMDGVHSNNWSSNLKKNKKVVRKNNKSIVTGVFKEKKRDNWRVQICIDGRSIHVGVFKDFDMAVLARYKAEIKYKHAMFNTDPDTPAKRYVDQIFL